MKNGRKYTTALRVATLALFMGAFFSRCANIMSPQGGPKDTIPPVIIKLDPQNFSTGFKAKKIYIEFDEYVQLKDQSKEFFTSPAMKKLPLLSIRGKGIVVTIRDTLQENTTYALDFGNAIRDNNEGNPLSAMRYVFSTGDRVDSLLCSGYTADSYKADSVSRTYIWFYIADSLPSTPDYDSTIFNRKPDVIARAQNNGIFIAQNLKPVNYRIYAFADKNDNKMYEAGTDMVGILDTVYNPATMPPFAIWFDSLRMYPSAEPQLYFRMFTDKAFKNQRLVEATRTDRKKAVLYFNTAYPDIESITLDSIPREKIILDPQTKGKDTVFMWLDMPAENLPDTIRGEITYFRHDSIRQYVKTTEQLKLSWKKIETKEEEREREKEEKERKRAEEAGEEYTPPKKENPFKYRLSAQKEVNPEKGLDISFDYPASVFDTVKVHLTKIDAEGNETPVERHFVRDTMSVCRYAIRAKWEPATQYRLEIPAEAVTDIMGYRNDSIKSEFTTFDPEKYASVLCKVQGVKGKQYIIQQTDGKGKMQQERTGVTGGEVRFNYVPAGDIQLRIIEDTNGNGVWDAGDVVKRLQPERAEMYANDRGETVFTTKVNWEFEVRMDMSQIFREMDMQTLVRMLDEREAARLKKLVEEMIKNPKKKEEEQHNHNHGSSGGMGMGGGMMGGMGGMMGGMGRR